MAKDFHALLGLQNSSFSYLASRKNSLATKWHVYADDVLPLWVADMDVRAPDAVLEALSDRVKHGVFGYDPHDSLELRELIAERLLNRFAFQIEPSDVVLLPAVIPALNLACLAFAAPGERVLVQDPVYPPIHLAPKITKRQLVTAKITCDSQRRSLHDWDDFDRGLDGSTKLFILCNPQNPTGRVFARDELERIGRACAARDIVICSDEIHCDLVFAPNQHIPIASLSKELADRTVTLMAPSKTFNVPGLGCAFAVITNPALRAQFLGASQGLLGHPSPFGFIGAIAAYRDGQKWYDDVMEYLAQNRAIVAEFVHERMPQIRVNAPEGTYLAWLDCSETPIASNPFDHFLKVARVALNEGPSFGPQGKSHVRLNFACDRAILIEALERMEASLAADKVS
jgi:cystathionine beta-lyase